MRFSFDPTIMCCYAWNITGYHAGHDPKLSHLENLLRASIGCFEAHNPALDFLASYGSLSRNARSLSTTT